MIAFENKSAAAVEIANGKNPKSLYKHQEEAMKALSEINKKTDFSAIIVLPTGAGKTLTSVYWLLKNAVNKHKKVLWLAHRHLLLEQAAEAFVLNSYSDLLSERINYTYRIISGIHDKPVHIQIDDDVLICGKDSIIKNLSALEKWINKEEIYVVVDEAHHAVSRTYRKIIDFVKKSASHVKMIGLTATPYRTDDAEKSMLGSIFTDDIIFSIGLDTLIKRGILSFPKYETRETKFSAGEHVSTSVAKKISFSDNLPEDLANEIAENKERNHYIVKTYLDKKDEYQQTIVFAVNVNHAIELNAVFEKYGVKSGYIVSDIRDAMTKVKITKEDNERTIQAYKDKKLDVLINVNILTEGTDLPQTKTVFLTRPTVSKVLMTQMVGRALRGEAAGGTKEAYIVSFVDNWEDKISFESPETIMLEGEIPEDKEYEYQKKNLRYIAISLLEEFARIMDETVDTSELENLPFEERIPLGMYLTSYIETDTENESSLEKNHAILVYNNSKAAWESLIKAVPNILESHNILSETIGDDVLEKLISECRETYFADIVLPPCKEIDIESLLKHFAYSGTAPTFKPISEIDRQKVNLASVAQEIYDEDWGERKRKEYLEKLWNEDGSLFKLYYTEYSYFWNQVHNELKKYSYPPDKSTLPERQFEKRNLEDFPLYTLRQYCPDVGNKLRNDVFEAAKVGDKYKCKLCKMTSPNRADFQIDHIVPMSKGGKTVAENLQLLCRKCNGTKSDSVSTDLSAEALPNVVLDAKKTRMTVSLGENSRNYAIKEDEKVDGFKTFTFEGIQYRCTLKGKGKIEKL